MHLLTVTVRMTLAAAGVLTPWLLLASAVVDAVPLHRAPMRSARVVCDARVPSRRVLSRIYFPPTTRRTVQRDVAALVQRNGTKTLTNNDDEAIQNDPSAVGVEEGRQTPVALEPLGVLVLSHFPLRNPSTFSPRSPRGPPAFN